MQDSLKPQPRHIHWRLRPCIYKHIVEEPPERAPQKACDNGDPEVVIPGRPNLRSVSDRIRHQTRAKVTSQIDRVAGLPAKTGADAKDQEEEGQGKEVAGAGLAHGARVGTVFQSEDDEHEHGGGDEFGKELVGFVQKGLRIRAEDSGSGMLGGWDGASAGSAFEGVDAGDVVGVDDPGGDEATEELRDQVDGEAFPGETAVEAVGERDGGIQVTA